MYLVFYHIIYINNKNQYQYNMDIKIIINIQINNNMVYKYYKYQNNYVIIINKLKYIKNKINILKYLL
jgi:hypothetical protein